MRPTPSCRETAPPWLIFAPSTLRVLGIVPWSTVTTLQRQRPRIRSRAQPRCHTTTSRCASALLRAALARACLPHRDTSTLRRSQPNT